MSLKNSCNQFYNLFILVDYILLFGIIAFLFAFIFKTLVDAKIIWKDVWVDAIVAPLLFLICNFLISYYLIHNHNISIYRAVGLLIIVLL